MKHPSWASFVHHLGRSAGLWLGVSATVVLVLSACSGSGSGGATNTPQSDGIVMPSITVVTHALSGVEAVGPDAAMTAAATSASASVSTSTASITALSVPDPGLLLMLVPDGQDLSDAGVGAWIDAASEEGVRIAPIRDSDFLSLGDSALRYAGLILPDSLHALASDQIVSAVQNYTQAGGKTMLVFDFGALTLSGNAPVYPIPRSRLSTMAGVDYVLYDQLRDRTTGLGPVTGSRSTLRSLLVPPGKSVAYAGLSTAAAGALAVANTASAGANSLVSAAGISSTSALYLPVSTQDPGGVLGFDVQQYSQLPLYSNASSGSSPLSARQVSVDLGKARLAGAVQGATQATQVRMPGSVTALASSDPVEAVSGYLLGALMYPSYVTQGNFGSAPGQRVLVASPQFGLVAGINPFGAGQVLFVNLPLTYLKGQTDALMMHGFLHLFTRELLDLPHLSAMPNAVAGMTLDWHLDSKLAQTPTQQLIQLNVFNDPSALFSIEMTAGPDAVSSGDKLGWNLPSNTKAQQWLQSFAKTGHAVGSHGGWIHDWYGLKVSESNQLKNTGKACVNTALRLDNFEQCLVLNRQSVDGVLGSASANYSAPVGNNPLWAMNWLEQRGVVAAYFAGHTGLGATRQYRNGQLLNPAIWVFPVTPFGLYATFEEFQGYNIPQADVQAWYRALVDFSIAQNTSRMVYAHPPGAAQWSNVLLDFLSYAKSQAPRMSWYSSVRLARFMRQRLDVGWTQSTDDVSGKTVFTATHPSSLAEMTWRLPRSRFPQAPQVSSGSAVVDGSDARYWLVRASGGKSLVFSA